ncbi:MAG: hypothetical protein KDC85_20290 [Saprospiraceae bacterium]|nr:hypothetical protein [Saprospiraceae bacterium]MCB9322718.1 hypothetical protein [Lewinellaceae bacterium]
MEEKQPAGTPPKPEPLFGKKFNLYGGIFILLLIALALFRHIVLDKPFGMVEEKQDQQERVDSLKTD